MSGKKQFSIFLENNRDTDLHEAAYIYQNPIDMISVTHPEEIDAGLSKIQKALDDGYHLAGWFSYEAGYLFEKKLTDLIPEDLKYPLIYMGVFKGRTVLNSSDADHYWQSYYDPSAYDITGCRLSFDRVRYDDAFDKIQEYLKAGDIYQVNFTQKANFKFKGSEKAFYASLRNAQHVDYAAYMECEELSVLSLSPELFIKKSGKKLTAKPMKGTIQRGRNLQEDKEFEGALSGSDKEKAENLMIVDLLRNDLSKMAQKASVHVEKLFEVEKYRTLFTMTSTIEAKTDNSFKALDVLKSVFPCGSVTGAPKIRAQEIIHELENGERGIYTGAIGYITPDDDMCFSVPIRTVTLDDEGNGELGVGSAVVADSEHKKEYDECLLKAQFLLNDYPRFDLIEAIKWTKVSGFHYLEYHLERLENSAEYFSFNFFRSKLMNELKELEKHLTSMNGEAFKIRVLLSRKGTVSISSETVKKNPEDKILKTVISNERVNSQNSLLQHKNSNRQFYQDEFRKYQKKYNCVDVIFMNEKGELTEGSYTNLWIEKDGVFYTPPMENGLLSGVYRRVMLENPEINTSIKTLMITDLNNADQVYLSNAIRGLQPVELAVPVS